MSNNSQIAFAPLGETVVIAAAASAPAGLQVPVFARVDAQNAGQYRITNSSTTITVFLGAGSTAAIATANAVAPTAGVPTAAIVLLPGTTAILRFSTGTFFSGVSSSAATVYITPGQGL